MYYSFFNQVTMSDRTSSDKMTGEQSRDISMAEFYANRPFIYFIRDYFGSICFAGVYRGGK